MKTVDLINSFLNPRTELVVSIEEGLAIWTRDNSIVENVDFVVPTSLSEQGMLRIRYKEGAYFEKLYNEAIADATQSTG
jgi:hypothetical protein